MKKRFLCIFLAALLVAALCGCGHMRNDARTNDGDLDILPDMVTPDVDDGVVTDQDGVIGNGQDADSNGQTGSAVSPSPTTNPGMTGTAPTTAPSASPKP